MPTFTPDQLRLLLTLTSEAWAWLEDGKGYGNKRAVTRQVELEGIQEKLREALEEAG